MMVVLMMMMSDYDDCGGDSDANYDDDYSNSQ